jgi:hypothetical protein
MQFHIGLELPSLIHREVMAELSLKITGWLFDGISNRQATKTMFNLSDFKFYKMKLNPGLEKLFSKRGILLAGLFTFLPYSEKVKLTEYPVKRIGVNVGPILLGRRNNNHWSIGN